MDVDVIFDSCDIECDLPHFVQCLFPVRFIIFKEEL